MAEVKISELPNLETVNAETGMEFEIEQNGISFKISLATLLEVLRSHFLTNSITSLVRNPSNGALTIETARPAATVVVRQLDGGAVIQGSFQGTNPIIFTPTNMAQTTSESFVVEVL